MTDSRLFFDAIRGGDLSQVRSLLAADPSLLTTSNESGASALLFALYTGQSGVRDLLLSSGAAVDLPEAVCGGDLERVKRFVEVDASRVNSFSPDGFPVFALACFFGQLQVARYLAEKGAEVHAAASNGSGYNALTAATATGRTETVAWLLERGLDPNYRYAAGYTPLLTAAANGHLEIVKLLLAHGADVRATANDGKSAIALAAERNHPDVAGYLRGQSASA
jgi:uncharacterized protein